MYKDLLSRTEGERLEKGMIILSQQEGITGEDHHSGSFREGMPPGFRVITERKLEKEHIDEAQEEKIFSKLTQKTRTVKKRR